MKYNKMKYKQIDGQYIGCIDFSKRPQTSWSTLLVLIVVSTLIGGQMLAFSNNDRFLGYTPVVYADSSHERGDWATYESNVVTYTENSEYEEQEAILAKLRDCESTDGTHMVGDSGDSLGWYQWQKESLEEVMGEDLTQAQYESIALNFEESHYWTRYAYFDLDQTWRWKICTAKINA